MLKKPFTDRMFDDGLPIAKPSQYNENDVVKDQRSFDSEQL